MIGSDRTTGRHRADEALLGALAGGATVATAASQAGVSEATTWRRLQDAAFRQRLDTARRQTMRTALDYLSKASSAAAATLATLMKDEHPASIRLAAARAVLDLAVRYREHGELAERLAALEAALADQGGDR